MGLYEESGEGLWRDLILDHGYGIGCELMGGNLMRDCI